MKGWELIERVVVGLKGLREGQQIVPNGKGVGTLSPYLVQILDFVIQ